MILAGKKDGPEVLLCTNRPKSFLTYLAELQNGTLVEELSEETRGLVEAIEGDFERFRGKTSGEIKLSLKFVLEKGFYRIDASYEVRRPKAPSGQTVMWLGADGALQTSNPKQLSMQLGPKAV